MFALGTRVAGIGKRIIVYGRIALHHKLKAARRPAVECLRGVQRTRRPPRRYDRARQQTDGRGVEPPSPRDKTRATSSGRNAQHQRNGDSPQQPHSRGVIPQ